MRLLYNYHFIKLKIPRGWSINFQHAYKGKEKDMMEKKQKNENENRRSDLGGMIALF